ncbi:MAG TPA: hypothetical protein VFV38_38030 [Ktedonobacteraceae bacterium]|nr:hypothetical protein [Ktedonobacteraceae bacterium]
MYDLVYHIYIIESVHEPGKWVQSTSLPPLPLPAGCVWLASVWQGVLSVRSCLPWTERRNAGTPGGRAQGRIGVR